LVPTSRSAAYVPALDGLRAVSVLAVIAYHLEYAWAPGGFLGVDVFFVLSGFLITSLLLEEWRTRGGVALAAFWARRVRRLLPALALLLLAIAGWALVEVPPERLDRLRSDALWTLGFGMNWHLITTGRSYFDLFSPPSPLRHLWSLAIEEQFYLVWPLVVVGALRLTRGSSWTVGLLAAAGLTASAVLMATGYVPADPSRVYYGTDTHAVGLLTGALLAVAARWRPLAAEGGSRVLAALGVVALVAVLAAFALVDDRAPFVYRGGLVAVSLATGLLILAARQRSPVQMLLATRPLVWTGRMSYGLYLWHWPLIVALTPEWTGWEGPRLDALRVGLTFAVSWLSYVWLEEPVRRAPVRPRVTLAATPAAVGALAAVILVATRGGTAPPSFYLTPGEQPVEVRDVVRPRRRGAGRQRSIAILGDSTAASLVPGFARVLGSRGYRVTSAVLPGCGIVTEHALVPADQVYEGDEACAKAVPRAFERLVTEFHPDLIVWLASRRDIGPRHVEGRVLPFATRDADRVLGATLEGVLRRLTTGGARIALLTLPPGATRADRAVSAERELQVPHYNTVLRDFAAAHADTITLVDFAAAVCPGPPPCPPMVEGRALRVDGVHFSRQTAIWIVKRLLPQLLAAGRF
jgi:peptidoglycan/LPS O-acetylase OafA/YrhL